MPSKVATLVLSQVTFHDLALIQGDIIAVDKGCELLLKSKLPIQCAVGDFDSISPRFLAQLQQQKVPLHKFPKQKDQSDAELALDWSIQQGYDQIFIVGFSGGRLDHYQAILHMLFRFQKPNVTLLTPQQSIQYLRQGNYVLDHEKTETYFSVLTLSQAVISLQGSLYPLTEKTITVKDTFTLSNEWKDKKKVMLTVHSGEILLYRTKLT